MCINNFGVNAKEYKTNKEFEEAVKKVIENLPEFMSIDAVCPKCNSIGFKQIYVRSQYFDAEGIDHICNNCGYKILSKVYNADIKKS